MREKIWMRENEYVKKDYFMTKFYLAISGIILFLVWCFFFTMVSPGYVGIVVNLFGEKKGASEKELGVGMHWVAPWKSVYKFPTFQQNKIWEKDQSFLFQTGDGLNIDADMGITFHLEPGKIHTLFGRYRKGLDEISDVFVRNYARDAIVKAASKMKVEDLYGTEKQTFMESVQADVQRDLAPIGIVVDRLYLIGTLHFPSQVVAALNAKIEATQRAQQRENELREAQAQAQKEIAKSQGEATQRTIEAEAKANILRTIAAAEAESYFMKMDAEAQAKERIAASLSPPVLVYDLIQRWDGKLPQFIGQVPTPFLDVERSE